MQPLSGRPPGKDGRVVRAQHPLFKKNCRGVLDSKRVNGYVFNYDFTSLCGYKEKGITGLDQVCNVDILAIEYLPLGWRWSIGCHGGPQDVGGRFRASPAPPLTGAASG